MNIVRLLRQHMLVVHVQAAAAAPAPRPDHEPAHPVRQYIEAIKRGLKRPFPIGGDVTLTYRATAALKGKVGEYTVKFSFQHHHNEIEDLDLVMYVGVDDMIGLFQARKIRAVSKIKAYRHTAKDETAVLSTDPDTVCDDIRRKFAPQGELNKVAVDLYKQAIRHLAARHVENTPETPDQLNPFDYGMELRRAFGDTPVHIDGNVTLKLNEVAALKEGDDVVVKFEATIKDLSEPVPDLQFNLYLATDTLTGGAGIRKIRFYSKAKDYSDSDTQHGGSLELDPEAAARELRQDMEHGPLGDVIREMALRASYQLAGGDANQFHVADDAAEEERGGGIDWSELGLEDPGL